MTDFTLETAIVLAGLALLVIGVQSWRYKQTHGTAAWAQADPPWYELPLLAVVGSASLILSLRHHHVLGVVASLAGLWLLLTLEVARLLRERNPR